MDYISYAPQLSGMVARHIFRPRRHIRPEYPYQLKPHPSTARCGTFINLSVCANLQRTIPVERRLHTVRRTTRVHALIAYQGADPTGIPSHREGL